MGKYLFLIITRMYAEKCSPEDEFVYTWIQSCDKEYAFFSLQYSDILLIHGYNEKYKGSIQNVINEILSDIQNAIKQYNLSLQQYETIYLFYHPQTNFPLGSINVNNVNIISFDYSSITGGLIRAFEINLKNIGIEVMEEIKSFLPRLRITRLSSFKHRINHILGPIDLDLQRLEEIAKANDYATFYKELRDFRKRYKDFDWNAAFNDIKTIIDVFLKTQGKKLTSFSNLNCLIKKERIENLIDFLKNMVKEKEVESVFEELKNIDRNSLSSWIRTLDRSLDDTIEGG